MIFSKIRNDKIRCVLWARESYGPGSTVSFMQGSDDRFQAESGLNCSSILTLLGSGYQKPA